MQPAASIPGADLYTMGPYMDPSMPVYKPEITRGLLSDSKAEEMTQNFAGGLLAGYQVRPPQGDLTQYGMQGQGMFQPSQGLLSPQGGMSAASQEHPQFASPATPQAPMPTMVAPVNPSGMYQGAPNPNAVPAARDSMFGDMTTGDLAKMFLAREMGSDPTALGGAQGVRATMAHNMLGGPHGLWKTGADGVAMSNPLAQQHLGIDLGAPASMEDAQRIVNWVNTQSATQGQGDGGR